MHAGTTRFPRLALRFLVWFRVVAGLDLALGLLILGYAAAAGYTWDLLRGGTLLVALGVLGFALARAWRHKLEAA